MKRMFFVAAAAIIAVLASCSNPSNLPSVTTADRDQAMAAADTAASTAFFGGPGWSFSGPVGNTMTGTGPNVSVVIVFSPSYAAFGTAFSYVTVTVTFNNYLDATTGYRITGTMTCVMAFGATATMDTFTFSGNLSFSGGNVQTLVMNATLNLNTLAYTGSVKVNGQTFTY